MGFLRTSDLQRVKNPGCLRALSLCACLVFCVSVVYWKCEESSVDRYQGFYSYPGPESAQD